MALIGEQYRVDMRQFFQTKCDPDCAQVLVYLGFVFGANQHAADFLALQNPCDGEFDQAQIFVGGQGA